MIALSEGRDDAAPERPGDRTDTRAHPPGADRHATPGSDPDLDPDLHPRVDLWRDLGGIPDDLAQSPVVRAADNLARAILRGGDHQAEARAYERALIDLQVTFAQNLLEMKLEQALSAPDTPRQRPAATNQN